MMLQLVAHDPVFRRVVRWLLVAILVYLALVASRPASGSCASSRGYVSDVYYLDQALSYAGTFDGTFWALGKGSPLLGTGADVGSSPVCAWAFTYPYACYINPYYIGIGGDWTDPELDGCVDDAGASPALDGDECMAMVFTDTQGQYVQVLAAWRPTFAVLSDRAEPGANPDPDVLFDFSQPNQVLEFGPLLKPTIVDSIALGNQVEVMLRVPSGLPQGAHLDPTCEIDVALGFEIFGKEVPAGGAPPTFVSLLLDAGWVGLASAVPFGETATATLGCGTDDTYVSAAPLFDSGFTTSAVGLPDTRIHTGTDTDLDGTADACDACTDTDADGFGERGFASNTCPPDNCSGEFNPAQRDGDGDGVGDLCDRCPGSADPRPVTLLNDANTIDLLQRFELSPGGSRVVYLAYRETGAFELFSVPTDGGSPVRLNAALAEDGNVTTFAISPDGSRLVYQADQNADELFELFSVPIDGGPVTRLNGTLVAGGSAGSASISPDGSRVVFRADQLAGGAGEIYSVPIEGGVAPTLLSAPSPPGWRLLAVAISPDGNRVVYRADHATPGQAELFSVPIDGGAVTKLNPTMPAGGNVQPPQITSDSTRVVYVADQDQDQLYELFSVPIDGGPSVQLNALLPPGPISFVRFEFRLSADGTHAVFLADHEMEGKIALFAASVAGGTVTRLSATLGPDRDVTDFEISPDSSIVIYRADVDADDVFELYSVSIDGFVSTKLNAPLPVGGDVQGTVHEQPSNLFARDGAFEISPDGVTVVYRGDQDLDQDFKLYSVPIDGAAPGITLGQPLGGGTPTSFAISPDGSTVVFRGSSALSGGFHLYSVPLAGGPVLEISDAAFAAPPTPQGILPTPDQIFQLDATGPRAVYRSHRGLFGTPIFCETCGDADADGLCESDNCPFRHNADQADADADGVGDPCDPCTDTDGDGFSDPGYAASACELDNCPLDPNPAQTDADGDGAGDDCDCAPADSATRRPVDVTDLMLDDLDPDTARLSWSAVAGADSYAVTRGSLSQLSPDQYGACLQSGILSLTFDDGASLPDGGAYFYLVQGESAACGGGSLGYTTNAGERSNSDPEACP